MKNNSIMEYTIKFYSFMHFVEHLPSQVYFGSDFPKTIQVMSMKFRIHTLKLI